MIIFYTEKFRVRNIAERRGSLNKAVYIKDLLKKLNKLFEHIIYRELAQFGLTAPQIMVLRQICSEPKTIGQISKCVDLSYSTVSGIIDRLERQHFVARVRDTQDRRVVWIKKTDKMEEIKKQVPAFQDHYYTQLFQGLTETEMDHIVNSLQILITQLEKKVEEKS